MKDILELARQWLASPVEPIEVSGRYYFNSEKEFRTIQLVRDLMAEIVRLRKKEDTK